MTGRPPGTLGLLKLLAWTSLLRLLRAARIRRSQRGRKSAPRLATDRKRSDGLMALMVVALPLLAFQALWMSSDAVKRLGVAMQHTPADADTMPVDTWIVEVLKHPAGDGGDATLLVQLKVAGAGANGNPPADRIVEHFRHRGVDGFRVADVSPHSDSLLVRAVPWVNRAAADGFAGAGALLLLAVFALLLSVSIGGGGTALAGGGWTQAWLLTFPVATRSLVMARALDYALVQFFPWFLLFPLLLQLLRAQDQLGAWWIAIAATLLTTLMTGALRLWAETWLRLRFSLRTLRSIQGTCTLLALLFTALVFGVCFSKEVPQWFLDVARSAPDWLRVLPAAWPVALASVGPLVLLSGALPTVVVFVLACIGTTRLLAHGAMRSGGVDPGRRNAPGAPSKSARGLGVIGKDLALLLRDRTFLVQALVVPVFVMGVQMIVNPDLGHAEGKAVAMLAYGIGTYSLIGGCFQVLSSEGRALWILYTLPVGIAEVLRRKTRIWASTAIGFGLAALLGFSLRAGNVEPWHLLLDAVFVGAGVFCAAHIAAGISILGTDPAADYVPRQPKQRHVYLYFFFGSTYLVALQSQDPGMRVAGLLVFGTLTFAIWQRACDRLPWLLDPTDEDRSHIGAYDGAAAVLVFFALQAGILGIALAASRSSDVPLLHMFVAYAIAGALTVLLFLVTLVRRGVQLAAALGLRSPPGARPRRAVLVGAAVGLLTGGLGLAYACVLRSTGWIDLPPSLADNRFAILPLAVIAAPLVEEVLFRALLFQGLLRSVKLPVAVLWSAGVFAAVHPMISWPPVFVAGVATAMVFHKTRYLPAAIALHATYNLVVIALQP